MGVFVLVFVEIGDFCRTTFLETLQAGCTTSPIELLTEGRAAVDTDLVAMRHRSGSFKRVLDESNQIWDRSSIG